MEDVSLSSASKLQHNTTDMLFTAMHSVPSLLRLVSVDYLRLQPVSVQSNVSGFQALGSEEK